jgi:hypothetical protein
MHVSINSFSDGKLLVLKCSYSSGSARNFCMCFFKNLAPSTRGNGYRKAEKFGPPAIQEHKELSREGDYVIVAGFTSLMIRMELNIRSFLLQ